MSRDSTPFIVLASLLIIFGVTARICDGASDGLKNNFYKKSCRQAEGIVKDIIGIHVRNTSSLPAKLLRMHFHDCFVKGCDASILLDSVGSTASEKTAIPNLSLSGFEVIDVIKARIEEECPGKVSCADILALAARDAIAFLLDRPLWDVFTGRRDGSISLQSDVLKDLPSPFANFTSLLDGFNLKGLNLIDLVALSGAHTIGVGHCATFSNRLYNFTGQGDMDPSLDPTYAATLKVQCPNPFNPTTTVDMDPGSSEEFDSDYFNIVSQDKGLFQSDAALLTDRRSARLVEAYRRFNIFFPQFKISMKRMGAIGVLTGKNGEIRKNCRVVNPRN